MFKIRASAIGRIMGGNIGLTDVQNEKLNDLLLRRDGKHPKGLALTVNMIKDMNDLIAKRDNPDLTEGMKTYCKSWLKEYKYGRREEVKTKYIDKGNLTEEDGFTLMCLELGLGMVYKNDVRLSNDYIMGECDLNHEERDTVFDNKSSWSLDQFPMFDDVIPNKDYEYQIQGYMDLYNRNNGCVVYTLNDIPFELLAKELKWIDDHTDRAKKAKNYIFTRAVWESARSEFFSDAEDIEFIEIPRSERIKTFYFKKDLELINDVYKRVEMCRVYINGLLNKQQWK